MVTEAVLARLCLPHLKYSCILLDPQTSNAGGYREYCDRHGELRCVNSRATVPFRRWAIGLTSLFFIALQSACTIIMALSGVRLLIGLGALAAVAAGTRAPAAGFHQDTIRTPMMVLAVIGSFANLYMVWRIRSPQTTFLAMETTARSTPSPLGRKGPGRSRTR